MKHFKYVDKLFSHLMYHRQNDDGSVLHINIDTVMISLMEDGYHFENHGVDIVEIDAKEFDGALKHVMEKMGIDGFGFKFV